MIRQQWEQFNLKSEICVTSGGFSGAPPVKKKIAYILWDFSESLVESHRLPYPVEDSGSNIKCVTLLDLIL